MIVAEYVPLSIPPMVAELQSVDSRGLGQLVLLCPNRVPEHRVICSGRTQPDSNNAERRKNELEDGGGAKP